MTVKSTEKIQIFPDPEALSRAAAELFAERACRAVASKGRFIVALAGGGTPRRTYELLARPPWRDRVPWEHCHIFWGDERCVPPEDERSNARMVRKALLDHVPLPPDQIHPIVCAEAPRRAAERYEKLLRRFFADDPPRFDLILLGLGENGHTASLFPDTPVLAETRRWAAEVYVAEGDLFRVTLTLPLINGGHTVAFLVSGKNKAEIFRRIMEGTDDPQHLPARLIRPEEGELLWLADREAISLTCMQPAHPS